MKFIEKYREANIYRTDALTSTNNKFIHSKIFAKGRILPKGNLQVDFVSNSAVQNEAIYDLKSQIDRYLSDQQMEKFFPLKVEK